MKLFIATPTNRAWSPLYGMSLMNLLAKLREQKISHAYQCMLGTSLLAAGRHAALQLAIQHGFTHALLIDDDMAFSPDAFLWLHERTKGDINYPLIAANAVTKPGSSAMRPVARHANGQPLSSAGETGSEVVREIGLAFALIDLSVLSRIPLPWFECPWQEAQGSNLGEDYYFCRKWRDAGHVILVDHDASRFLGHIGEAVYTETGEHIEGLPIGIVRGIPS